MAALDAASVVGVPLARTIGNAKVKRGKTAGKIVGTIFVSWWIFLLVIIGLAGNAYLAIKALQAGNIAAGLLFGVCFGGACVYCYRTYNARDEIRGIFRD